MTINGSDKLQEQNEIKLESLTPWFALANKSASHFNNGNEIVRKWVKLIKKNYDYFQTHKSEKIPIVIKGRAGDYQIFDKSIDLLGQQIVLHFNIGILEMLVSKNVHAVTIELSAFSQYDTKGLYQFSSTENIPALTTNDTPIIIVPLNLGNSIGFVADGNHRLTAKYLSEHTKIKGCFANHRMASISLTDKLEQSIYSFIADINLMEAEKGNNLTNKIYKSELYELCVKENSYHIV